MSLFTRVLCTYWSHPKTSRLKQMLGNDALWIPVRLWSFAAEHRPDGLLEGLSAEDLAAAIGYSGSPKRMLKALIQARFVDAKPLQIHNWSEHNWYHSFYHARAKKAAEAKWKKVNKATGEGDTTGGGQEEACPKNASSMFGPIPEKAFPKELEAMLAEVREFRRCVVAGAVKTPILREHSFVDDDGVKQTRQLREGEKLDPKSQAKVEKCDARIQELKAKLAGLREEGVE